MARPTGPKPPALTQLQATAVELFTTLGAQFDIAEHRIDLSDVHVPMEMLLSTREIAALAMRYTQWVHQAASPGVAVGSDVVVALATDLNLMLTRLAREAGDTDSCRTTIENAQKLLTEAACEVVALHGTQLIDLA